MTSLVVTGLGLVLPCGDGIAAARAGLAGRRSCFTDLPVELGAGRGAMCTLFNPAGIIPPMQLRRLDRCSRYAWVAAAQAFQGAGLDPKSGQGDRIGVAAGTMTGGEEATETFLRPYFAKGPEGASPMVFPNCVANAASGHIAVAFALKGPSATQLEREVGAFAALDQASRWLHLGLCDAVLVMGMDGLSPMLEAVCGAARLLARHGDPGLAESVGFLAGEGAIAIVLERAEDAKARGAKIRARLGALHCRSAKDALESSRLKALQSAVEEVATTPPARRIGGANGHPKVDGLEASLAAAHRAWPEAIHPKLFWGEFGGSGAQLIAAGLLESSASTLVTGPSSFGGQWALRWDEVEA